MTPKELLDDSTIVGVRRTARMTVFGHGGHDDQDDVLVRPPTFASPGKAGHGRYVINGNGEVEIDTPQRQNRRASEKLHDQYGGLLPENVIAGLAGTRGPKRIGQLGHRLADAAVRASAFRDDAEAAFRAHAEGNVEPMVLLDPTSLVFGVFNSRGETTARTQVRGLYCSRIAGFGAVPVRSGTQYQGFIDDRQKTAEAYSTELRNDAKKFAKTLQGENASKSGFVDQPVPKSKAGQIAAGDEQMAGVRCRKIVRTTTVNVIRARGIARAGDGIPNGDSRSEICRQNARCAEYVLGLGLLCLVEDYDHDLRQGAQLIETTSETVVVRRDGTTEEYGAGRTELHEIVRKLARGVFGEERNRRTAAFSGAKALEELEKQSGKDKDENR